MIQISQEKEYLPLCKNPDFQTALDFCESNKSNDFYDADNNYMSFAQLAEVVNKFNSNQIILIAALPVSTVSGLLTDKHALRMYDSTYKNKDSRELFFTTILGQKIYIVPSEKLKGFGYLIDVNGLDLLEEETIIKIDDMVITKAKDLGTVPFSVKSCLKINNIKE